MSLNPLRAVRPGEEASVRRQERIVGGVPVPAILVGAGRVSDRQRTGREDRRASIVTQRVAVGREVHVAAVRRRDRDLHVTVGEARSRDRSVVRADQRLTGTVVVQYDRARRENRPRPLRQWCPSVRSRPWPRSHPSAPSALSPRLVLEDRLGRSDRFGSSSAAPPNLRSSRWACSCR